MTTWMMLKVHRIGLWPASFAFPHNVDIPDFLAREDPLDVSPLSGR